MKLGLVLSLGNTMGQGGASGGILDTFAGAFAAYSLRYLSSNYTEDVILARRSSDNAELGFTPTEITDGTLGAWAGAGNAFVKTWYDQSGSANDIAQLTTSEQPLIVSSGALVVDANGFPTIQFSGAQHLSKTTPGISSNAYSGFIVNRRTGSGTAMALLRCRALGALGSLPGVSFLEYNTAGNNVNIFLDDGLGNSITIASSTFAASANQVLSSSVFTENTANVWINSVNPGGSDTVGSGATPVGVATIPYIDLGGGETSRFWVGTCSELILYDSNQSDNRGEIENAINAHYGIF